jgi:SAM-dependent methyltransferase
MQNTIPNQERRFSTFQREALSQLSNVFPLSYLESLPLFQGVPPLSSSPRKERATALRDELTILHELNYWENESNKHGVVMTPSSTVAHLVECLKLSQSPCPVRILDPACGTGRLLCGVLEERIQKEPISSPIEAAVFLKNSLYGIDRDPVALTLARLSLLLTLNECIPNSFEEHLALSCQWFTNFSCGDFLANRTEDPSRGHQSVEIELLFPTPPTHIIANPPYGLSRNEQISKELLEHYKKSYAPFLCGKPNKYMLFLIRSLQILEEGGRMSFLIPNSWLGIRSGEKIRKYLLQQGYLRTLDTFSSKIFRERGVETVIVTVEKSPAELFELRRYKDGLEAQEECVTVIPVDSGSLLEQSTEAIIPLYRSENSPKLIEQLRKHSTPLQETPLPLTPKIALQVYSRGRGTPPQTAEIVKNHLFHSVEKVMRDPHYPDGEKLPYLEGKCVERFSVTDASSEIWYGPWVSEYHPLTLYQGPRIVLREILGKAPNLFIASVLTEECLYNRSILHIVPKGEEGTAHEELCHAVVALLNSLVGSFYLIGCGRKASRKLFPKIVLEDLKDFPIPLTFKDELSHLSAFSRAAHKNGRSTLLPEEEAYIAQLYDIDLQELHEEFRIDIV